MEDESHPCIRLEKKDLCMFLALHMEKFPECVDPSEQFNKTGIVICESDKVHKIVAMSFSKPGLHAVHEIIRCLPSSLRDCTVYLSRKPCTTCTTFLIQGSVSSVYYWPRAPEMKGSDSQVNGVDPVVKEGIQQADHMFLRSHVSSSVLLPTTSFETMKSIAKKIRCKEQQNSDACSETEDIEECYSLLNIRGCKDTFLKRMKNAFNCYNFLLKCSQLEENVPEEEEPKEEERKANVHRHALQLCYFLAARSDDPDQGVGCTLYSQDGYFFGAGYNGYPIGILYANLPAAGRSSQKTGPAKREVVLHAEANVLLYRSKAEIEESDVLYCTKPPCGDCQKFLKDVKIKTIHCVEESSKQSKKEHLDDLKKNFYYHEWKHHKTQLMEAFDGYIQILGGPPAPHLKKEDLCMFLALHMENSSSESQTLCDLLASRSDNNNGVGTVIYKEDNIVALGYSGYPKGAMNSLFGKKTDVDFDQHAIVCAEANAIIMSSERDLCNADLITTREPCQDCLKLIRAKNIARVIWPLRD